MGDDSGHQRTIRAGLARQADDGGECPEEGYSLFLVPDARWRDGDLADDRAQLWEEFFSFGRSTGDTHAAIWFLDQEDNVAVLRSQEYCRRFGLSYNDATPIEAT